MSRLRLISKESLMTESNAASCCTSGASNKCGTCCCSDRLASLEKKVCCSRQCLIAIVVVLPVFFVGVMIGKSGDKHDMPQHGGPMMGHDGGPMQGAVMMRKRFAEVDRSVDSRKKNGRPKGDRNDDDNDHDDDDRSKKK